MNYKKIWSEVITASLIIIISAAAIISFVIISGQDVDIYNPSDKIAVSKGADKISEVLTLIQTKYIGEVDVDKLIDGAIDGIFSNIEDPYTRYLDEKEYSEAIGETESEYYGIGVHISLNGKNGEATIIGVMPSSPAKDAGIRAGDVIKKVGDVEITKDNYHDASALIKGKEGTSVDILIDSHGEEKTVTIVRQKIIATEITSEVIDDNIGYIRIFEFGKGIYNDFKNEYDKLINEQKVTGLVVDLRNNPGGFVDETVKIADLLAGPGLIIREEYGDGTTKTFVSGESKCEVPLVLIVNENSASAAEILAGSIKDLKAGTIVGTTTFGKGIMQGYVKLENGGGVAITVAEYFTASGEKIHKVGITPDVLVEATTYDYTIDANADAQLKTALEIVKNK